MPFASAARYSLAILGPIGSAGAQFALSLVLLRVLDQGGFGRFSFLLVLSQFTWGIWTALFCAPLPLLLSQGTGETRDRTRRTIQNASLIGAVVALILFGVVGMLLGEDFGAAAIFAAYAAMSLLRWFARAHAYAIGAQVRTTISDMVYAATVLIGAGLLLVFKSDALLSAWAILFAGATLGMIPFGRTYLREQFLQVSPRALADYRPVWREHSRWSLFGVATTEATANAHTYFVILLMGPTAFAPIAASALIIRPINVAMNALTEFERAQMARQIGAGRVDLAHRAARFFRAALALVWLLTAVAIVALFYRAPSLIFPPQYDIGVLVTGVTLWMLVSAIRAMRTPESALLQAAGAFQPLARASLWSSIVSIVAVLALLMLGQPLWSIVGILFGEAVFAALTWRAVRVCFRP